MTKSSTLLLSSTNRYTRNSPNRTHKTATFKVPVVLTLPPMMAIKDPVAPMGPAMAQSRRTQGEFRRAKGWGEFFFWKSPEGHPNNWDFHTDFHHFLIHWIWDDWSHLFYMSCCESPPPGAALQVHQHTLGVGEDSMPLVLSLLSRWQFRKIWMSQENWLVW